MATPQLRWSSARSCPRKAVYQATGAPAREATDREQRILWRGRSLGREYANFLRTRYPGRNQIFTELKIDWPYGTGHADIYVRPARTTIEVLSSANASAEMVRSKMLQLVCYMTHAPSRFPVNSGAVVVLDPNDFTDEIFPLAKTSSVYRDLVEEMHERFNELQAWADQGTLPARVCTKPSDARKHFCRLADHCFQDWQPPELDIVDDPVAVEAAERLYEVRTRERAAKEELSLVESERKEVEQRLADLIPAGKHQVGDLEISRTHVDRSPSFDWRKAQAAGVFDEEVYAEFFKPGASYDLFRVDVIREEAEAVAR